MILRYFLFLLLTTTAVFAKPVVNVYVWGGEIPAKLIQTFEAETGINVNFSTYDSNETMYAKLRASQQNVYDVIIPSAYFVERMRKKEMLTRLDKTKLPNLINIDPLFIENTYDNNSQYSVPLIWGATGIFYNQQHYATPIKTWRALWKPQFKNKLMLLDDSREVFAIALMSLGFDPNDRDPTHIKTAYTHLLALIPNIKLFASDSIQAIMIDEDANAGMAWNGDVLKAHAENKHIHFTYPDDGFIMWVDCLAIPKNPPHPNEAYQFVNFLLKATSAARIALEEGHAITNTAAKQLLPSTIRDNPLTYPSADTLKRGHVQRDVGEETLTLYNQYWQSLKLAF